jgi:SEC-C motif-containing protein
MVNVLSCPCGSQEKYQNCCQVFHKDISKVETAQQLMRSRYSAFTKVMGNYLMNSHHSTTRPLEEKKAIVAWTKSLKWEKLEILNTTKGLKNDTEGTVEFKAYYIQNTEHKCIHENSQFVKENGVWMYLGFVE